MKRRILLLLCCALLLSGCGAADTASVTETTVVETEPQIRFPDGEPGTVTCLGSYTVDTVSSNVVAQVGKEKLTNQVLQAWYWAEVAQFRQSGETGPDFDQPLDAQACDREGVTTWQQYFVQEALNSWHTAQALILQSEDEEIPTEEAYDPNLSNHEKYMTGMPATEVLYGYQKTFRPNAMHQAYLDTLPELVSSLAKDLGYASGKALADSAMGTDEESLLSFARDYNYAYMYFTSLTYLIEPTQEEIEAYASGPEGETVVDFRHILCETAEECEDLLRGWKREWRPSESNFAQLAYEHSLDAGSASEGGLYRRVTKDQIPQELAQWCFDPERVPGDSAVLDSEYGAHALYLISVSTQSLADAEQALREDAQRKLLEEAREKYPMKVTYEKIALTEAEGALDKDTLLYADLAHQRFTEVPLYLQQDYPGVMYGGFELRTNGCGITAYAMLMTYLSDEELTPPEMCAKFGRYSHDSGTDSGMFLKESAGLGAYMIYKTYEWREAKVSVEEGYPCIVLERKGYWTTGGHYLVLEEMDEDGMVKVRDSNIFNFSRVRDGHLLDRFPWDVIYPASSGYWIFEKKDVTHPACTRCGTAEGQELCSDYFCKKCEEATLRRGIYLTGI